MKLYNKQHPPVHGTLTLGQWTQLVDDRSFPVCDSCENPIYHPDWYEETGMCGPCTTGESETLMLQQEEVDPKDYPELNL